MRSLRDVLECIQHADRCDDQMRASICLECDRVLRGARAVVSDRLRGIMVEYELLDMHDAEDRAYFRDFLMAPTTAAETPSTSFAQNNDDKDTCHTADAIDAACAWMLRGNMGLETETLFEIFDR